MNNFDEKDNEKDNTNFGENNKNKNNVIKNKIDISPAGQFPRTPRENAAIIGQNVLFNNESITVFVKKQSLPNIPENYFIKIREFTKELLVTGKISIFMASIFLSLSKLKQKLISQNQSRIENTTSDGLVHTQTQSSSSLQYVSGNAMGDSHGGVNIGNNRQSGVQSAQLTPSKIKRRGTTATATPMGIQKVKRVVDGEME
jgi:hypothetical protein